MTTHEAINLLQAAYRWLNRHEFYSNPTPKAFADFFADYTLLAKHAPKNQFPPDVNDIARGLLVTRTAEEIAPTP